MSKLTKSKKFRYGTNATILTALFIVIVIVLNIGVGMLVERFPSLKIDLSSNNMFSISQQTRDAIGSLEKDVTIYVVQTSDGENTMYNEILNRYKELSPHIDFSYVNVTQDPSFLQKYSGQLNPVGSFVIESGERFEIVSSTDVLGTTGRFETAENTLTNAILSVTSNEKRKIYFTTGHEEPGFNTLENVAEEKFFDYETIDLRQQTLGEADMLIIGAPKTDFTMAEIDAVDSFVKQGGSLQIYLDPQSPYLTNLCEYIKEWGIEVKNEIVNEEDSSRLAEQYDGFIPTVANTDYSGSVTSNILCTPSFRLDILYSGSRSVTSSPVLTTSSSGTATPAGSDQKSEPNTFNISVLTTRVLDDQSEVQMYVCGTPLNLTAEYRQQFVGNIQLATTLFTKMLKSENLVDIPDKTADVRAVSMSMASVVSIVVIFVLIAFGILNTGIVIWIRRRRL